MEVTTNSSNISTEQPIIDLPIEILVNIASNLTTIEYGNLRRTCKTIETKLFYFFATEFFTKRQIFIFPLSIQNLIDISNHPELSKHVQTVIVGMEDFQCREIGLNDRSKHDNEFHQICREAAWAFDTGAWADLLQEALEGLPNLSTIQIRDFVSSRKRWRDGTYFRSYYVRTLEDRFDGLLPNSSRMKQIIVPKLLYIAAKANLKIQSFEAITRTTDFAVTLVRNVISANQHLQPRFSSMLQHLRTLMLCIHSCQQSWINEEQTISNISPLFEPLTNLEHLRLNFENSWHTGHQVIDTTRRAAPTADHVVQAFTASLKAPTCIKTVELGKGAFQDDTISSLFEAAKESLEHIGFHHVCIYSAGAWKRVVDQLSKLPNLRSFYAKDCSGLEQLGWSKLELQEEYVHDIDKSLPKDYYIIHPVSRDYEMKRGTLRGTQLAETIQKHLIIQDDEFNLQHGFTRDYLVQFSSFPFNKDHPGVFGGFSPVFATHRFDTFSSTSESEPDFDFQDEEDVDPEDEEDVDPEDEREIGIEDDEEAQLFEENVSFFLGNVVPSLFQGFGDVE